MPTKRSLAKPTDVAWGKVYAEILQAIDSFRTAPLYFRGHRVSTWPLLPSLARVRPTAQARARLTSDVARETTVYTHFLTRAGDLIPAGSDPWSVAFSMQHHGLPTRLLDWTTSLAVALFFAIRESDGTGTSAIWILNPFTLNQQSISRYELFHPSDLHGNYEDYFVSRKFRLEGPVVAIYPLRHNPRVFRQQSGFTLHEDLTSGVDMLFPQVVRKVEIPPAALIGARRFLQLAGVSAFSLFPDLDALARELKDDYF